MKYLYENSEDFSVLPTYYIMPAMQVMFTSSAVSRAVPGKEIGLEQVLHGEHYIEMVGEVPPQDGKLVSKFRISEVLDKGSGAAIVCDSKYNSFRSS